MKDLPKTHYTAVVLIPPEGVWEPIQAIRRIHDPQERRWMPHLTMLYPFVPEKHFAAASERVAEVCRRHAPLELTLADFRTFEHNPTSATLWLDLEPRRPVIDLQADLEREFPQCSEASAFEAGFVPHLSVGRFPGRDAVDAAMREFQFAWMPLEFTIDSLSLIARSGTPDDPFHLRQALPLGGST